MIFKLSIISIILLGTTSIKASDVNNSVDVISYQLTIQPTIENKHIRGTVVIRFRAPDDAHSVTFNAGNLKIHEVSGDDVSSYENRSGELNIQLSESLKEESEVTIEYSGHPSSGLLFDRERGLAFTIYSTSQWMICNDSPGDKALFYLTISVPKDKTCIASGDLVSQVQTNDRVQYSFEPMHESPSYTYGFAIGNFNQAQDAYGDTVLKYYSQDYSLDQLSMIFRETPTMLSFFEQKSGVKYDQSTYSQLLVGNHYQEMSGYSTLKDTYGRLVLEDSAETNLISHELAHQWWGNRVTCKNWNHFWLNEAMATYMSAAYNEQRFGQEKYQSDINSYQNVYEAIKSRGNDKSLVFTSWSSPSGDDRNLVYFKGAYVLHLLREKMGNEAFWAAIKYYTIKYWGESVETADFEQALEESSGMQLDEFFNVWVYYKK